jgi:hypothetical protein
MKSWKRFALLITIGLISLIAMRTIMAQDNNGHGNGNGNGKGHDKPTEVVQPTQDPGNNGNHHGGGNNGNGNGNGGSNNGNGNGKKDDSQTDQSTVISATDAPVAASGGQPSGQPSGGTLGCQKNNPSRLDCSSLDVKGVCSNGMAVFTIHNSGSPGDGDMRAATQYRLVVNGVVVETGSVQLPGGGSGQVTYSGSGSVTLEVDQQVGHPGNSHPRVTLDCGGAAETPTVEPTQEVTPTTEPTQEVTPTTEPTQEVTPTVEPTEEITPTLEPALAVDVICKDDGSIVFVITNNGGDMLNSVSYMVSDIDNNVIDSGQVQLAAGDQTALQYAWTTGLTLTIGDLVVVANPECVPATPPVTPEPTQEVTPTVEPTDTLDLVGQADCNADGSITFTINNVGADMTEPEYYTVTDSGNMLVADGYYQMMVGEPLVLTFSGYPSLTFRMRNLVVTSPDCGTPTPEPTVEVTPPVDNSVLVGSVSCQDDASILFIITNMGEGMPDSAYYTVTTPDNTLVDNGYIQLVAGESTNRRYSGYPRLTFTMGALVLTQDAECIPPTPEVSPTPEPTQEVTPTAQPTEEVTPSPTPAGTLGCQKNNPDRRDCSSLQVSGTCQSGVAVFTVRNMGKAGEGDMVSATQYHIIVNGVEVQTGTVQLKGGSGVQITYSGSGSVTLIADQQVGHPGSSQPQATVNCSA